MKKYSLILALAMAFIMMVGVSAAMAVPAGTTPLAEGAGKTDTTEWGTDNGLVNANKTGEGVDGTTESFATVIKNVNGQKTHGEYANDTNSCASCHQTHTADGRQLLFKNGIYNTCAACHDGTLGFYNVFATGANASNAGTFGGMGAGASVHMATGTMKVSAAPGGNRASTTANTWGKDFTCASCHSPHGSYSDRLLHYNPNGLGTRPASDAGQKKVDLAVAYDATNAYYYAVDATGKRVAGPYLYGYSFGRPKIYWTQIRVLYDSNGDGVEEWNYKVQGNPTQSYNDVLQVNYRSGYFKDANGVLPKDAAGAVDLTKVQMDVAPANIVKMNKTLVNTVAGIPVEKVDSYKLNADGTGLNEYCAACHTDYNANSAASPYGTFSKAFRHKIVQGLKTGMIGQEDATGAANKQMVCLSCHYAHGTDNSIMADARDVKNVSTDVNASSALKRYYNMAVCYKCHTDSKAEQLKNNNFYWDTKAAGTNPIH